VAATTARRQTAEERREGILAAALTEFAARGLHGTSTEDIARRAGISQPYVFRLFGTKKHLFIATVELCLRETLETFEAAAEGRSGMDALEAMGESYRGLLDDRARLMGQMQAYAATDDPDVRAVIRQGYGDLVEFVERVSGADVHTVSAWFAKGMLLNVVAAMDLTSSDAPWAQRLLEGCKPE
jgi:AcrR family transcriptional regulator